jgi:hypothetical protein
VTGSTLTDTHAQRIDEVIVGDVVVTFTVVVAGAAGEAPRVSVRAAGGSGVVDVLGVQERARPDGGDARVVAFACEAERGPRAFDVAVVVDRPGRPPLSLPGPHVPALDATR